MWLSIIEMLRKRDQLPVVAFTFSKKKIEDNAGNMQSVDLTDHCEKSDIHIFFQKSISRLKGSDKNLPQVRMRCALLFQARRVLSLWCCPVDILVGQWGREGVCVCVGGGGTGKILHLIVGVGMCFSEHLTMRPWCVCVLCCVCVCVCVCV